MTAAVPIRHVGVVVPSRNEDRLLPACLAALRGAADHALARHPQLRISTTIVLDSTTDSSFEVLAGFPWAASLRTEAANVGVARNLGVRALLGGATCSPASVWVANTDADSEVPRNWLTGQVELAAEGWDVVVGTVEPQSRDLSAAELRRWFAAHPLAEGHDHIHGANLGFRGSAFTRLHGFEPAPLHEDRKFVQAARTAGLRVLATDRGRVTTSGRRSSRVDGGFAAYLAAAASEPDGSGWATDRAEAG